MSEKISITRNELAAAAAACSAIAVLLAFALSLPMNAIQTTLAAYAACYLIALAASCALRLQRNNLPSGTAILTLPPLGYGLALLTGLAAARPFHTILVDRLGPMAGPVSVLCVMATVGTIMIITRLFEKAIDVAPKDPRP